MWNAAAAGRHAQPRRAPTACRRGAAAGMSAAATSLVRGLEKRGKPQAQPQRPTPARHSRATFSDAAAPPAQRCVLALALLVTAAAVPEYLRLCVVPLPRRRQRSDALRSLAALQDPQRRGALRPALWPRIVVGQLAQRVRQRLPVGGARVDGCAVPARQRRRRPEQRRGAGRPLLRVDGGRHASLHRLLLSRPVQLNAGQPAQLCAGQPAAATTPAEPAASAAPTAARAAWRVQATASEPASAEPAASESSQSAIAAAVASAAAVAARRSDAHRLLLRQHRRLLHGLGRAGRLSRAAPACQ